MNELRKDYLLDRWVIIAKDRAKRPTDFKKPKHKIPSSASCVFCPGRESETGEETYRYEVDGKWIVRVFKNIYPAATMVGDPRINDEEKFFTHGIAYGSHEVLVETPEHGKRFSDLSEMQIRHVLDAFINRINALNDLPGIRYVSIFKNQGQEAGASIFHAHSQILALNVTPSFVKEKMLMCYDYIIKNESCPYCEIIKMEAEGPRKVFENESIIAFTPYASRFPFEVWFFPKRHLPNLNTMSDKELNDLASALKKVIGKLDSLGYPSYNLVYFNAEPKGENFHFHIELLPRLSKWAGFEMETGIIINTVPPEEAAMFYRGEK
ncbi:galactose-1-phosphate uridylyltransferase [Candidatus Micrarchaeota archaeon]|nr:MAG: galactose-1-phosphate uridylyltransferase [Candidatus Micrarchaeota archaeon]